MAVAIKTQNKLRIMAHPLAVQVVPAAAGPANAISSQTINRGKMKVINNFLRLMNTNLLYDRMNKQEHPCGLLCWDKMYI
ncbi:MAG: hypothetical protein PHE63_04305 [Eubacteriales bacterium]|nr:hypothetical protein [Eubacteriales bacterium]